MIYSICTDFKQGVFSTRFCVSSVILLLMFCFAPGVPINDDLGVDPCTILRMLFTTDEKLWLKNPCFSSSQIWLNGIRVMNLGTFLPAVVSFPILPLLADELKSQNYRFHCIRGSYCTYILSKCIASMLIAFCVVFFCIAIFWILCWNVFPSPAAYSDTVLGQIYGVEIPWNIMFQLTINLMLFAAMNATIGVLLTVITIDKFASNCLPVVLAFLANQVGQKMYIQHHDVRYFCIKPDCFYQPDMWFSAFRINASSWVVLIIPIILSIMCVCVIYNIAKRKMQQ